MVCTARLVAARVTEDAPLEMDLELTFDLRSELGGACAGNVTERRPFASAGPSWRARVGSSWVLFLRREPRIEGGWRLTDRQSGAWRVEIVERLDYEDNQPSYIEVIVPDSISHVHDLPAELFDHETLRQRYFGYSYVSFEARVISLEKLVAWLEANKS